MIKVTYRDAEIASYVSRMEAEVAHGDDLDEVSLEEFCDICESVKVAEGQTICDTCYKGIHLNIFI